MNKIILFLTLVLAVIKIHSANALELYCSFEEVYLNGEIQQGFILMKGNNLRYEYYNPNLYTIIYDSQNAVIIQNKDRNLKNNINHQLKFFEVFYNLVVQYPNTQSQMLIDKYKINIDNGLNKIFYKRISVLSDELNMSVYFNNCNTITINKNLFNTKNFIEFDS